MQEFINGKVKEFWSGSIVGFIAGVKFLFTGPMDWGSLVLQYTIKFVAVCVFAFMSGLFTVMAGSKGVVSNANFTMNQKVIVK